MRGQHKKTKIEKKLPAQNKPKAHSARSSGNEKSEGQTKQEKRERGRGEEDPCGTIESAKGSPARHCSS